MAYKQSFNPDALPAHVEPQQAAQLFSQQQASATAHTPPAEPAWKNKPPPPLPPLAQQQQQQSYGSGPPSRTTNSVSPGLDPQSYSRPSQHTSPSPVYGQSYPPPHQRQGSHPGQQGLPGSYPGGQQPPQQQQPPGAYPGRPYSNSPGQQRPAPSPSPSPGVGIPQTGSDSGLFPVFRSVDINGSGQLTEDELGRALKNGDYTSFDIETVRMMIKMFDHDRSGTIGFEEFCGLWGFLGAWRQLFDRFDEDRSGYISYGEYTNALVAFGYHLTPNFVNTLYSIYGRRRHAEMSFDLFVQSCISLKRMTDVFKRYDTDRDGFITLSFEEFLTEILNQK